MAVQKFRTFEEARRAAWLPAGDERILDRMRRMARQAAARRPIVRGVQRLRSLEEAKGEKGAAWQVRPDLVVDLET